MKRLLWNFDLLVYQLFYWRWSPRLKGDPDLAYIFSKLMAAWTNGNPPRNPDAMNAFIAEEFAKHGKQAKIDTSAMGAAFYVSIK